MVERSTSGWRLPRAALLMTLTVGLIVASRWAHVFFPGAVNAAKSYLLFHSIVEIFTVVVGIGILMIAWNARRFMENHYLLLVGIGLGAVAIVGLLHLLAYRGMGIFEGSDVNLPAQLWIVMRLLTAATLVAAPIYLQRRLPHALALLTAGAVTAALVASCFAGWFPTCYDEAARRLTPFKIGSEYVLAGVMLIALALLIARRSLIDRHVLWVTGWAIGASIAAGMAFTLYSDPHGYTNMAGHVLQLTSFYLFYLALIETSLKRPYDLLFRNLKISEEAFRQSEAKYRVLADNNFDWEFWIGPDGQFIYVSPSCLAITGYKAEEFLADAELARRIVHPDDLAAFETHRQEVERSRQSGRVEFRIVRRDGSWRWIEHLCQGAYDGAGRFCGIRGSNRDCTDRVLAQQDRDRLIQELKELGEVLDRRVQERTAQLAHAVEQLRSEKHRDEVTGALLQLFTRHSTRKEYLDSVLQVVQQWARCRCVGIRIMDSSGGIPYECYTGFSEEFWKQENSLSVRTDHCVCIRVIQGRPDAAERPMMTPYGSFLCPNSCRFVESLSSQERGRFRGTCLKYGFTSLAVIPICFRNEILGAIHLADEKAGLLTRESVEFLEAMSPLIGEAVHRFNIEDELRSRYRALHESEERYRLLFNAAPVGIALIAMNGTILAANHTMSDIFGYARGDLPGMNSEDFYLYRSQREVIVREIRQKKHLRDVELQMKRNGGEGFPAAVNVDTFSHRGQDVLLVTLRDMTEHRRLEAEVLAVSEKERQRIGQDLHDSLGQNLTGIAFLATVLQQKLTQKAFSEAADAATIERHVSECVRLTRSLARGLSPIGQNPDSLLNGLRELAANVTELFRVQCILRTNAEVMVEDPVAAVHMYRIAQEAVHNALKHGRAQNIGIELSADNDLVSMSIEDDGTGIGAAQTESSGMGLRIMKYRSASIGASLEIRPRVPQGTAVTCMLRLAPRKEVDNVGNA